MPRATTCCSFLSIIVLGVGACDVGLGIGEGSGSGDDVPECESYPLGEPRDPETLPECCPDYGGAHCVPSEDVPEIFANLVDTCEGGGMCVPDPFIKKGGVHVPQDCTVELDGSTGVCLSACVPQVGEFVGILKQDICPATEYCVPCVNPLDGTDTGACALRENSCDAEVGGGDGDGDVTCPHEGPPVIDPASFPVCDQCGDASCVTKSLVPTEFHSRLSECDADSFCVPNELVETAGNFIPPTCESLAGFEGRCLSDCLPEVQEQADLLPQSSCTANQKCVPCYDPLTGMETGACGLSCDVGPDPAGPTALPDCCEGPDGASRGTCIPADLAGDNADSLAEDTCPADSGLLCAPDDIIRGTFVAKSCQAEAILGFGGGPGACLPDCLGAVDSVFVGQGDCTDGFKCAPCEGPFGGDTGACDFLAP